MRVQFPYEAYDVQKQYMEKVITACEEHQNAMLESPTGTGKTLSLLCASLGWLEKRKVAKLPKEGLPKILYLSRTHSQLAQVVKELKKTVYKPVTITLGSRDQMCVNSEVNSRRGGELDIMCRKLRRSKGCPYYDGRFKGLKDSEGKLMDIEEWCEFGKKHRCCPFYLMREAIPTAELLLLPYNYLLDPKIRTMYNAIEFSNSVIIFDEAHNVQKVSEDASSFETSVEDLGKVVEEGTALMKIKENIRGGSKDYDDIAEEVKAIDEGEVVEIMRPVSSFIDYLKQYSAATKDGLVLEGRHLFEIFLKGTAYNDKEANRSIKQYMKGSESEGNCYLGGITADNCYRYMEALNKCVEALAPRNAGSNLLQWYRIIEMVYYYMWEERKNAGSEMILPGTAQKIGSIDDFKVVVATKEGAEEGKQPEMGRELKVYCFNPGIGFFDLLKKKPLSVILTSGTLSPMDTLERELRIKFPIKLESKHVVSLDQVSLNFVTRSELGRPFNFNYQNRGDEAQLETLGKFVRDVSIATPGGVLVFFSSYGMLNTCVNKWKRSYLAELLTKGIRSFREERVSTENQRMLEKYRRLIERKSSAVLFAVCRGKISEGLDFSDDAARTVIMIGIPFQMQNDKRVVLKREYLDAHFSELNLRGSVWYTQDAVRTVNQAVGRVIRHIHDYGSIILVDERYSEKRLSALLSKWIRDISCQPTDTAKCTEGLRKFFAERKTIEEERVATERIARNLERQQKLQAEMASRKPVAGEDSKTSHEAATEAEEEKHTHQSIPLGTLDQYFYTGKRKVTTVVDKKRTAAAVPGMAPETRPAKVAKNEAGDDNAKETKPADVAKAMPASDFGLNDKEKVSLTFQVKKLSPAQDKAKRHIQKIIEKFGTRNYGRVMGALKDYKNPANRNVEEYAAKILEICREHVGKAGDQKQVRELYEFMGTLVMKEEKAKYIGYFEQHMNPSK